MHESNQGPQSMRERVFPPEEANKPINNTIGEFGDLQGEQDRSIIIPTEYGVTRPITPEEAHKLIDDAT